MASNHSQGPHRESPKAMSNSHRPTANCQLGAWQMIGVLIRGDCARDLEPVHFYDSAQICKLKILRQRIKLPLAAVMENAKMAIHSKRSQRAHDTIITSLWRLNDVATSFWRHNDVIIALCVRWDCAQRIEGEWHIYVSKLIYCHCFR